MSLVPQAEGPRLVGIAGEARVPLRLFGGVGIWCRASEESRAALGREYADVDVVAHKRDSRQLRDAFESAGYAPERNFNAVHGASRLMYHAPDGSFHVDVFLDRFVMSHQLDFIDRLEVEPLTLPAADLLLTKLQVAEINEKDLRDTAMLLLDHEPGDGDGAGRLNLARVCGVCAEDWGLYTTVTDNLASLAALGLPLSEPQRDLLGGRIEALERSLEAAPKSRSWKLRARIGRRRRWYEVPEEVTR